MGHAKLRIRIIRSVQLSLCRRFQFEQLWQPGSSRTSRYFGIKSLQKNQKLSYLNLRIMSAMA